MMRQRPRIEPLFLMASALLWQAAGFPVLAQAHRVGVKAPPHQASSGARATSHRSAPRHRAHGPVRQPRSLLPPAGLGSAANVPPGFYQRLNAPQVHHRGGHRGAAVVPVYVYVEPLYTQPLYSAPVIDRAPPAAPPPATPPPAPQIYIVNPQPAPPEPAPPAAPPAPPEPRSTEPGEVQFSVTPPDARVYLDDEYLGTGAELAALPKGRLYAPGVHVLEVTHPDYRPQRLVFGVSHKDPVHVLIDLATERFGRRSRIK